ncbi:MAG TPA: Asp23/Gls24 family envelope stress response protein [Bacillales bacterium]|nr:Asp23/Gls24 family envelope stress response protein [Bacillales bacterium]
MTESTTFEMEEHDLGKVEISPEVIEVIASIAANEVTGVSEMRGSFATGVAERLGRRNHRKGVKVELAEDGITIDVYVLLKYGVSIPETGQKIQDNICQTLRTMTSLDVKAVNIHVTGIQFEQTDEAEDAKEESE